MHYASRVVDNGKEKAVVLPLNMDTVPHVSECNTCLECVLDDGNPLTTKGSEGCSQSGQFNVQYVCRLISSKYVPN